jgi:oligopeptide transport system substrate-binding protein
LDHYDNGKTHFEKQLIEDLSVSTLTMFIFRMDWKILLLSLLLVGCGGGSEGTRVDVGNRDGVLHFGNGTEPAAMDPHIVTGVPEHHVITALFEGLVTLNPDTLEAEPGVAESWDISADGITYTFNLREDALWTNGDPVTAEDFRWSWERALTPALGSQNNYMLFPINNSEAFAIGALDDFSQVGAKVLDEHTFQVTLRAPTPYFLQLLNHYITYPVHRPTVEAFGSYTDRLSRWSREGNIVTNGPFKLTEWRVSSRIRVEKNASYWDADKVRLNAIVYYPTENLVTEERMFRDRQIHFTSDVPLDKIPVYLDEQPDLIQLAPYLGTYYYLINTKRKPFDDLRVREALAMSIDRDLLSKTVLENTVTPAYALTPPGTLGYQPPQTFEFDPDLARQLLTDAGYPGGEGFPAFEILYNTQESHRKIAVAIQQMWQSELGISALLLNQEWRVYLDTQDNSNYDVSRRGWIGDYVDPNTFLDMMITDGGNNKTGFGSPRYDELILRQAPNKLDQDERFAIYHEAETIMMEEMPIIPIYTYQNKNLKNPSLKGLPPNIMGHYNWKYVYLEATE